MGNDLGDRQRTGQATTDDQSGILSSRRGLLFGAALVGALATVIAIDTGKARARPRRRRRRHRRGGTHCYLKGTLIETPAGERCIEGLEVGDLVKTASGALKPVKWVSRWTAKKSIDHDFDWDNVPVKVARGALNGIAPHRDLYVTDEHSLFIDGVLIPAIDLVNDVNITKELPPGNELLTYFHIELEDHDVIIANGAQSETLRVAAGDRKRFDNGHEYLSLYAFEAAEMQSCALIAANNTRLKELQSRIRTAIAPLYDIRQPHEVIWARLADRAMRMAA